MKFHSFYEKAYAWIIDNGPKFIIAIVLFIAGLWLISLVKKWVRLLFERKNFDSSLRSFFPGLITIVLQVILFIVIMQILGLKMTIFAAVLGAMGVAFGLALSGTLQNFTSGILILMLKPYRIGDNIIAQGQEGIVSSIQLFSTVVITFDNKTVIIPNSKLSNEVIINTSRQGKRRIDIEMKFNFGFDFDKIKQIVLSAIHSSDQSNKEPEVGISSIEPDGFKVMIHVWVNSKNFEASKFLIQQKIIKELKGQGIKLPGMS